MGTPESSAPRGPASRTRTSPANPGRRADLDAWRVTALLGLLALGTSCTPDAGETRVPPHALRGAVAFLTAAQVAPGAPPFSGSAGTVRLAISRDYRSLDGRLNLSGFGTDVAQVHIHLGRPGGDGPPIFTIPATVGSGVGADFRLDQRDFCADRPCDPDDLRTSGVRDFRQAVGSIEGGNAYVDVHTRKHPGGEVRGLLFPQAPSANVVCFPWGCACEGYDDCNRLIAACPSGGSWRCIQYNEWGGCEVGACVLLGPPAGDFTF